MKLEEIKAAIEAGKKVYWKNDNYEVVKSNMQYLIKCTNGSCIGLTWMDEVTMNGKEEDFYVAEGRDFCRNCGCKFEESEGVYYDGDDAHCEVCHPKLYTEEEWNVLCVVGLDEGGEEMIGDSHYYTEHQSEE